MGYQIDPSLEFVEVINAFPVLKDRLESLNFNVKNYREGESLEEYFLRNSLDEDEIDLFVKKLNFDVNYYLKNGETPKMNLRDEKEVLEIEEGEEEE